MLLQNNHGILSAPSLSLETPKREKQNYFSVGKRALDEKSRARSPFFQVEFRFFFSVRELIAGGDRKIRRVGTVNNVVAGH